MTLAELRRAMVGYGIRLTITENGNLRPTADEAPPPHVIEAIRTHRIALLRQLEQGRAMDGQLNVAFTATQQGHCGCCDWWDGPDAYGDGLCSQGRAAHGWLDGNLQASVITTAHHQCAAHGGRGWNSRATHVDPPNAVHVAANETVPASHDF